MPIDFTLNDNQRRLRHEARQFAKDVLSGVPVATRDLPSPIERFVATRPFYERLVAEGFLRKCIPVSVGGDCAGLVDLAILAEEFYTVDANVSLTMLSTVLGLAPLVVGGKPEQHQRFLPPFLAAKGAPLAAFASTEPGGSANVGISTARRRRPHHRPAVWRLVGHLGPEAMDICGHRMERTGCRPAHRRLPHRCQGRTLAWHLDHRCASSRQRPGF